MRIVVVRSFLLCLCCSLLLCGTLACQPTVLFELPGQGSCSPPAKLREQLKQSQSIPSCMLVVWEADAGGRAIFPVVLRENGGLTTFGKDGSEDAEGRFDLPPQARGKTLQFRLYVHMPKSALPSFGEHTKLCDTMSAADFYCFAPGGEEDCWMTIQFQPQSDQSSQPTQPLPAGKCRFCERETCDKKDNNCNGKIDEFDEVNNRSCPAAAP